MKFKICFMLLCVFMLNQVAFAAEAPSYWAQGEISEAIELGILPEKFQKDYSEPITREDFCELMLCVLNSVNDEITSSTGLSISAVHYDDTDNSAVKKATQLGIVRGKGNNLFDPKGNITRQEAAVMLHMTGDMPIRNTDLEKYFDDDFLMIYRVMDYPYRFADYSKISYWASDSVQYCYQNKIMVGVENDSFQPLGQYSREQAYLTALRLYKFFTGDGINDERYERKYRMYDNKQVVMDEGIYKLIDSTGKVLIKDIKKNIDAFAIEGSRIYDCCGEYIILIYPFDNSLWLKPDPPEFTAALYRADGPLLNTLCPEYRFTSNRMILEYDLKYISKDENGVFSRKFVLSEIVWDKLYFVKSNIPAFS